MKAGLVFGLLAVTIRMLRRYDRRAGTTGRRGRGRNGWSGTGRPSTGRHGTGRHGTVRGLGAALSGLAGRPERVLDVVERAALGRTTSAVLVRVRDQHFLLGVSDSRVTMLLEVDLPDDDTDDDRDDIDLRAEGDTRADELPGGFAGRFGAELLRQARQHLPGGARVELIDPPVLPAEGLHDDGTTR